ncbi:hypothetical protein K431DRAFT_268714 [Polychaeton citri CBS 116435]|uniref:Wings apart-like protein C-terminal domain-containing protein n=1 Tax=Polychaeton citri CBS 116435 TaxID=1314669 RepID=A0A9P4QAV8_9PEZI|nr:hypothetical protein K431DRAFT_268714 [Polychaeton citri CBS 116435]
MATMSTPSYQKLKKVRTYGRNQKKPTYNLTQLDEENGLSLNNIPPSHRLLPARYGQATTSSVTQPTSKATQSQEKSKVDAFDVPASDEEADAALERPLPPPRLASKRSLLPRDTGSDAPLASWERKKIRLSDDEGALSLKSRQGKASSSQRVDRANPVSGVEASSAVSSPGASSSSKVLSTREKSASSELGSAKAHAPLTAAAKLAARRNHTVADAGSLGNQPSGPVSRAAKGSMATKGHEDDSTTNTLPQSSKQLGRVENKLSQSGRQLVTNIPQSSAASSALSFPDSDYEKAVGRDKRPSKPIRKKPIRQESLRPPVEAAPGSQVDVSMIVEPPTTPREAKPDTSETDTKTGRMTPRQAQIWSNLLEGDALPPSPSVLPMEDLKIESHQRPLLTAEEKFESSSARRQAGITRRKIRLVHQLKAAASSSSESEGSDSDVEMEKEDDSNTGLLYKEPTDEVVLTQATNPASEPPSFTKPKAAIDVSEGGPKITYGKVRSYLADDTIEEGLLDSLPTSIPERPPAASRRTFKSVTAPQPSVFDLDDSGDDSGAGNLRSIHELRASGRNTRLAQDIEALMADLSDWSATNRSRRRSALLELANKMCDKGFTDRFFTQGADQQLTRECTFDSDEISELTLAAVMALAMASEPPEHVIWSFERSSLLSRFVAKVTLSTNIKKMVKERKNNMARSAQESLLELAHRLQKLDSLWGQVAPDYISTDLLSLKFLDLLISRLRRLGDQNELLDGDQIALVFEVLDPNSASTTQTNLAISILESLSTLATTHEWPARQFGRLADLLSNTLSCPSPSTRHTAFLALRLCLNLTNDDRASHNEPFITPTFISSLLCTMKDGFAALKTSDPTSDREAWAMTLDSVVLTTGIMINLAEHDVSACKFAAVDRGGDSVKSLVQVFRSGQKSMLDAESVEESTSNVAFGYLAIMLANLCADKAARTIVAQELAAHDHDSENGEVGLGVLLRAVEEFVLQHQKVDMIDSQSQELEGAGEGDGKEVWGAFTERLKSVLERFRMVAQA